MPGLLRTEAYARALLTNRDAGSAEVDQLVYDCLARRVLLTRASRPLEMTLALDEALLHRPLGGPAVMAGQLRFLADTAVLPNVRLRVVPSPGWGTSRPGHRGIHLAGLPARQARRRHRHGDHLCRGPNR